MAGSKRGTLGAQELSATVKVGWVAQWGAGPKKRVSSTAKAKRFTFQAPRASGSSTSVSVSTPRMSYGTPDTVIFEAPLVASRSTSTSTSPAFGVMAEGNIQLVRMVAWNRMLRCVLP